MKVCVAWFDCMSWVRGGVGVPRSLKGMGEREGKEEVHSVGIQNRGSSAGQGASKDGQVKSAHI
eukprot:78571-Chlamydomonas_euryale.AAC.2